MNPLYNIDNIDNICKCQFSKHFQCVYKYMEIHSYIGCLGGAMVSVLTCYTGGAEFLLHNGSEFQSAIIARPILDIYT